MKEAGLCARDDTWVHRAGMNGNLGRLVAVSRVDPSAPGHRPREASRRAEPQSKAGETREASSKMLPPGRSCLTVTSKGTVPSQQQCSLTERELLSEAGGETKIDILKRIVKSRKVRVDHLTDQAVDSDRRN